MQLTELSVAYRTARRNYEQAFRSHFNDHITELPEDRFWELQSVFTQEVRTFRFAYRRSNGVEQAAGEFFRKSLAGDFGTGPQYTLEEATCFAKSWRAWKEDLYMPLFDVVTDRSDDAYGDLLDALPLAGREVCQKSRAGEFANQRQLDKAVLAGCDGDHLLAELILHGENYLGMSLYDAAQRYFALAAAGNDSNCGLLISED